MKPFSNLLKPDLGWDGVVVVLILIILEVHEAGRSSFPFFGLIELASSFAVIMFHFTQVDTEIVISEGILGVLGGI